MIKAKSNKKRPNSPQQSPSKTKRIKSDQVSLPCAAVDIDTELSALQLQSLLNFGRRQGWPIEPQYDIAHRFFHDDAAFADMIIQDLSRDLKASANDFPLTDLRGTGYYGQYHLLLLSKEIKQRLRQLVPQASEDSLARAVVQASPLIFQRLIQADTGLSRTQVEDLLVHSRSYGYIMFPATLIDPSHLLPAQEVPPIPTVFVPPTRASGMLALSTSSVPETSFHADGPIPAIPPQSPKPHFHLHQSRQLHVQPPQSPKPHFHLHQSRQLHASNPAKKTPVEPGQIGKNAPIQPVNVAVPPAAQNKQRANSPAKKASPVKKGKDDRQQDIRAFLPKATKVLAAVPPVALADPAAAYLDDEGPAARWEDYVPVQSKDHAEISSPWRLPVEWRGPGRYPVKANTRTLGQGGFGTVFHCVDRLVPGREVAKKRQLLQKGEKAANRFIRREVAALQRCQGHKGVVALNDVIWGKDGVVHFVDIVLPLAAASLDKVMRANREGLDQQTTKTFVLQIAEGLAWIHHRGWIHLDLKPANVLVFKNYVCQITDFGLSRPTQPNLRLKQPCGTIGYRPPEELFNVHFAQESMDIWPLGTIYAELRKGFAVFDQSTPIACFKSMIETVGTKRKNVFQELPPGYGVEGARSFTIRDRSSRRISFLTEPEKSFVWNLWKLEPADRPKAKKVAQDPFWNTYPRADKSLVTLHL
ncbi:hypothetical protein OC834_007271 [Tilletia horrida]|nr:hypothetical protein OC834_007271 [Tilletia horrida]